MPYQQPALTEKAFAIAAAIAMIAGIIAIPISLLASFFALSYIGFYRQPYHFLMEVIAISWPLAAMLTLFLGKRAFSSGSEKAITRLRLAELIAAWAIIPVLYKLSTVVELMAVVSLRN